VAANAKQREAEKRQAQQSTQLVKLLQDAKAYVTVKSPLEKCPVCEQRVDPVKLQRRLSERINSMQGLATLVKAAETAKRQVDTKKSHADQARKHFCQHAKTLGNTLKSFRLPEAVQQRVNWNAFPTLLSHLECSDDIEKQGRQLVSIVASFRRDLQTRRASDQKSLHQHNAIKGFVKTLEQNDIDAKRLERLSRALKATLEIVSQQRKDYVEGVLKSISKEVTKLYAKLHPTEGIGNIRFYLKPNVMGSLEIDGQFHATTELPPQAYYSESHLDTLGICVFLALSNRFKTDNTLLILDDVLTSVDSSHLDRFMTLLHDQALNFNQLIITTHYRPWRDRYRWAKGPAANTQVVELGPWTLQNGVQTGEFLTALEELKQALGERRFDRQVIASKAGIVLESLLDFLTLKYRCKVPRNARNEHTLGDLAIGIDSKLGKELRTRRLLGSGGDKADISLKPLIDASTAQPWIRNAVGCHFNILGSDATDKDVRGFCESVVALATELVCASCKMLPTRRPSGSYWECKCGNLELYPLIYPGADPRTVDDEG